MGSGGHSIRLSDQRWSFMRLCQPGSSEGSTFPNEPRHQLDMRRVPELVERSHALKGVAAIDEDPAVARKACYIAGYRNHHRNLAGGELAGLRLRALTRRIEHHGVIVAQLLRHQRTPEQIADLGLDRL